MKNKFKIKVFFNRQNILLVKIHHGLNQIKLSRMCYKLPFIENKQKCFIFILINYIILYINIYFTFHESFN